MVQKDRVAAALGNIHQILCRLRNDALDGKVDPARFARVLDWAEYMPSLLARADDVTEEFRDALMGLGESDPEFAGLIKNFDAGIGEYPPQAEEPTPMRAAG